MNIRAGVQRVVANLARARAIFSLDPVDTSTSDGRGRERYRRIALSSTASVGARAVNLIVSIAAIPLVLGAVGPARFGVWATVASLILVLGFTDLGLGNGLLNAVAHARGTDNQEALHGYVSSAFFFLALVAALLGIAFALGYGSVPWGDVLSSGSGDLADDLAASVAVLVAGTLAALPFTVVQHTQAGLQESFKAHLWTGIGGILTLVGLIVGAIVEAPVPLLVLPLVAGPFLAMAANFAWSLGWKRRDLLPRLSEVSAERVRHLARLGGLFFVLQLAVAIGYQSDQLIVAHYLGPRSVAEYAVTFRLFFIAPTFLGLLLTPFWPAYREAMARGDSQWVRRAVRRTFLAGFAVNLPPAIFLMLTGRGVASLLTEGTVHPPPMLLLGMAVWATMSSLGGPLAVLLNAASYIGFQVITSIAMAIANVALSIVLVERIGVVGPVFGSIIAQLVFVVIPAFVFLHRKGWLSGGDVGGVALEIR